MPNPVWSDTIDEDVPKWEDAVDDTPKWSDIADDEGDADLIRRADLSAVTAPPQLFEVPSSLREVASQGWQNTSEEFNRSPLGLPAKALALLPKPSAQTVQDALDVIAHPTNMEAPSREPSATAQRVAGGINVARSVPETFTTPVGMSTLGMGALPQLGQRLVSAGFLADMAYHTPEAARVAGEASVTGDDQAKVEAYGNLAMTPLMASAVGLHAVKGPHALDPVIDLERPRAMTPEEAAINRAAVNRAVNRAAPGTVRPAELEVMGAPTIEPPSMFQAGEVPFERMQRFGGAELPPVEVLPQRGRLQDVQILEEPRSLVERETRGKTSFGAEAPALVRNAVEQAEAVGLTKSAEALKVTDKRAVPRENQIAAEPTPLPPAEAAPRLVPVVRTDSGRMFGGERHPFAVNEALEKMRQGEISAEDLSTMQQGFYDLTTKKYLTREEAGKAMKTGGEITSEQIPEAELKRNAAEFAESNKTNKADVLADSIMRAEVLKTEDARALGEKITTAEEIARLKERYDQSNKEGRDAWADYEKTPTDVQMQAAVNKSNMPSLINEAIEAATGAYDIKRSNPAEYRARMDAGLPAAEFNARMKVESGGTLVETPTPAVETGTPTFTESAKVVADKLRDQFKTDVTQQQLGTFGIVPKVINAAVELAAKVIEKGGSVADAIAEAVDYIRKNHEGYFNEAEFNKLIRDKAATISGKPGVGGAGKQVSHDVSGVKRVQGVQPDTTARPAPNPPQGQVVGGQRTVNTLGTTDKMRKSAERATTAEMVPEPVQERIADAPESRYTQQSMSRVEDVVSAMPDAELAKVSKDTDIYTASKLEQARRLFDEGENDAGYNVFVELEKEGTRLGQLINQFKLLKSTTPENVVRVIDQTLTKAGKDRLNKQQKAEATEIATRAKEADTALDVATKEWERTPTSEKAKAAEVSLDKSNAEAVELQKFVSKFQPRSTAAILKSVLQGNLLTPISETANIFGNMSFLPFRAAARSIATGIDMIDAAIRDKPREVAVQPLRGTAEALKGAGRGVAKVPSILARGTGDTIKGETRAGLHPMRAWVNQFAKNPEMPTTGGKLTLKDRLNLAIEGTFGVPAEAMLRGLGAGDAPFKEAARARVTSEQLRLAKVPKDQWPFAQKFPEIFLTPEQMRLVTEGTNRAVFQGDSPILNKITQAIHSKGEVVDFAVATIAPYKVTPWNIIGEILSYNPLVAMAKTVNEASKGNGREAKLSAGKFVIGSLLSAAGVWLYQKGLLAPSLDERDEAQKARVLSGKVVPPNHLNLSGLKRALEGGDPSFKAGDETVDVFRAGGLAGSIFYMTANIGRDTERNPKSDDSVNAASILRQSTLEQARFGLNQSFLSGVEGLLTTVKDGNTDNFVRQWINTVSAIPLPNTMAAVSRATREGKPDFSADTFNKKVENAVRNKLGFAGMDDYLPLKRDFWGQPLPETPKGRNALFYQLFDISKNQQVTSDPVELELYRLWRTTGDSRVIPSLAEKSVTLNRSTFNLTPEQHSRYAELVGNRRREIIDQIVVNPEFVKLPDEHKIRILDRVYRTGMEQGKGVFSQEFNGQLTPKPSRSGFKP